MKQNEPEKIQEPEELEESKESEESDGSKKTLILLAVIAIIMASSALYFLANHRPWQESCFQEDYCFLTRQGQSFQEAVKNAETVTLILSKEEHGQEAFQVMSAQFNEMIIALNRDKVRVKHENIYGIEYKNGRPYQCIDNNAQELPVEHCTGLQAPENGLLIIVQPPGARENKAVLDNNRITFQGDQGSDIALLMYLFRAYYT